MVATTRTSLPIVIRRIMKLIWDLLMLVIMASVTVIASKISQDPSTLSLPFLKRKRRTTHENAVIGLAVSPEALQQQVGKRGLDDLIGYEKTKACLRRNVVLPLKHPHVFYDVRTPSLRPPSGILLYGPPGTGKTAMARACAYESGASFVPVDASAIESKWYGETPKLLKAIFDLAKTELAPCVVFFDEIDSMGRQRTERDQGHEYSLKCELLRHLDSVASNDVAGKPTKMHKKPTESDHSIQHPVVVMACTNALSSLDEALSRRFPTKIKVDVPSRDERVRIVRSFMKEVSAKSSSKETSEAENLNEWVADCTEGFSGSDLRQTFREACSMRLWGEASNNADMEGILKEVHDGVEYVKRMPNPLPTRKEWVATGRIRVAGSASFNLKQKKERDNTGTTESAAVAN